MATPIPVDADTIALWRFAETEKPYFDEVGDYIIDQVEQSDFTTSPVGQAIQLPAGTGNEDFGLIHAPGDHSGADSTLDTALDAIGDGLFTVEALVNVQSQGGTFPPLIEVVSVADDVALVGEVGSQVQLLFSGTSAGPFGDISLDAWHYIAIVRGFLNAEPPGLSSTERFQIYVDGVLIATDVANTPSAVSGAILAVGAELSGGVVNPGDPSLIYLTDLRLSSVARTPAEIIQTAIDYGLLPGVSPEPPGTPPTVTLVSPPEGTIGATDTVVVDVEDVDTNLQLVVLSVLFAGQLLEEVVYRSSNGFGPRYSSSPNQATNLSDGIRFTLRRAGGWPSGAFAFSVDVVNVNGQEPT